MSATIPILLVALAGYGYGVYSGSKRHEREVRRTEKKPVAKLPGQTRVPRTPLVIAPDCSTWEMPDTWILQTAEPRFRKALDEALLAAGGDIDTAIENDYLDPVDLTYAILKGEVGPCPLPLVEDHNGIVATFRDLQADTPQLDHYYPHAAMLGLYDTIYEAVDAALSVLSLTGDPNRVLLFPV